MASAAIPADTHLFRSVTKTGNAGLFFFVSGTRLFASEKPTFSVTTYSAIWAKRWLGAASAQSGVD